MARALIVGCGCRGRELGAELGALGWRVRGTTRSQDGAGEIAGAGVEPALADPQRPGTVLGLIGDVTVIVWLLGSAAGDPEELAALHGDRLEALLTRLVDTPVRGFAYEAVGTVGATALATGRAIVERASRTWRIPLAVLETDRGEPGWAQLTAAAVAELPARR